jgi:hypothetical protein
MMPWMSTHKIVREIRARSNTFSMRMNNDTLSTDSDSFVDAASHPNFSIKVVLALDEWGEV